MISCILANSVATSRLQTSLPLLTTVSPEPHPSLCQNLTWTLGTEDRENILGDDLGHVFHTATEEASSRAGSSGSRDMFSHVASLLSQMTGVVTDGDADEKGQSAEAMAPFAC